jgi:hypothetical protein
MPPNVGDWVVILAATGAALGRCVGAGSTVTVAVGTALGDGVLGDGVVGMFDGALDGDAGA